MTTTENHVTQLNGFTTEEWQHMLDSARAERNDLDRLLTERQQELEHARTAFERTEENYRQLDQILLTRTNELNNATSELRDMTESRDALTARRDALVRELGVVREQVTTATNELTQFKDRVVETATSYANEHGWCSVVDQALSDMGLARKKTAYQATLQITVSFTAELREGRDELPSDSWVQGSLRSDALRRAIVESFGMDSDHRSASVGEIDFEVSDVDDDDND